ncbi:MAG TPA: carbon monoxide dehydrogenase subunit G [Vicinamibacterales bacterium]
MELKGQYRFDAPVARVWERLMDPATISACLPGCQRFEPAGDDRYQVVLTAGVAAITGTFEGTVTIADKLPERSYRLIVEGKGRPGFATGEAHIELTPDDARVVVDVAGAMTVGGLVAQVGQRLLGATARMMMDRFFKCLQGKIAGAT